ncbi:hypothetical protein Y1Q_0013791 [Alligator mississippiensis]|uniref:Uncharacterized protein n=1 Tax=Alligator mississippiensis TaxID=8496 RepID=A0A151MZE5_ALLMI|nr:hypothetical protein Y1Q_0013791 [Alligator mississippiensis]
MGLWDSRSIAKGLHRASSLDGTTDTAPLKSCPDLLPCYFIFTPRFGVETGSQHWLHAPKPPYPEQGSSQRQSRWAAGVLGANALQLPAGRMSLEKWVWQKHLPVPRTLY